MSIDLKPGAVNYADRWDIIFVLPPTLYDQMAANGANMVGYIRQTPLPRTDQTQDFFPQKIGRIDNIGRY